MQWRREETASHADKLSYNRWLALEKKNIAAIFLHLPVSCLIRRNLWLTLLGRRMWSTIEVAALPILDTRQLTSMATRHPHYGCRQALCETSTATVALGEEESDQSASKELG
jgi:hypothetical protein